MASGSEKYAGINAGRATRGSAASKRRGNTSTAKRSTSTSTRTRPRMSEIF